MILSLSPLEEGTLIIFTDRLLLLGGVELLRCDLLRSGLVRDDSFLDLLGSAAQPRQEWIWNSFMIKMCSIKILVF